MGTTQKSDGRYIVGKGISNANEYKGSMGYRDIVIQLTESGATAESVQKLNYLKDYALYHSEKGEPIIPPNTQIWISGNGFSKAVEADDIDISDDGISIGGIVYADDAWDCSHAGEGGGGGSGGGGVLNVTDTIVMTTGSPITRTHTLNKTFSEIKTAWIAGSKINITGVETWSGDEISYVETEYFAVSGIITCTADDAFAWGEIHMYDANADWDVNVVFEVESESEYPTATLSGE